MRGPRTVTWLSGMLQIAFRELSPIFRDLQQERPVPGIAHEKRRRRNICGAGPALFRFAPERHVKATTRHPQWFSTRLWSSSPPRLMVCET